MMRMKTTKGMRMMVRNLLVLVARLALAHVCIRLPATGREREFRLLRREREWDGPAGRLLSVRLRARFDSGVTILRWVAGQEQYRFLTTTSPSGNRASSQTVRSHIWEVVWRCRWVLRSLYPHAAGCFLRLAFWHGVGCGAVSVQ